MDSMAYYACATAFAIRGLGAPVIFTGATLSARDPDSDFRLNLPNAVKVAVKGCCYFLGITLDASIYLHGCVF